MGVSKYEKLYYMYRSVMFSQDTVKFNHAEPLEVLSKIGIKAQTNESVARKALRINEYQINLLPNKRSLPF